MKKYCLTDCFKRKMSSFWKEVLATTIIISVIAAFVAVITGIGWVIGFAVQHFGYLLDKETLDVGMSILGLLIVLGTIAYWTYKMLAFIGKGLYGFAVAKYEGTHKCNIFEECKENK